MGKNSYNITDWLLKGDPWVIYRTRIDLLCEDKNEQEVKKAYQEMLSHQKIEGLLSELTGWPGEVLSSHKSAGQLYHKLTFIADLGISKDEPKIKEITNKISEHISEEGLYTLPMNIPEHFGGKGIDQWAWALCDAPVTVYALAKMGFKNDASVIKAADYVAGLVKEKGWLCTVSKELGKFRGPGRKDDPCPYATLVSLKMLLEFDKYKNGKETKIGAETLLSLWEESKNQHPYMFYMGNDFKKIKAPYIWYDLLHMLEVLTKIKSIRKDKRLLDMVDILEKKKDPEGKFTAESEWRAWKDWEFGQKKEPSRWITFLATRILKRLREKENNSNK